MTRSDGRWSKGGVLGVLAAAFAAFGLGVPGASAQIPDKFTNLQVLPKDITKPKLVETMRGFTVALGVRCTQCHVGEEGQPFDKWDFPSDAKPDKATARLMMRMTADLNSKWISQVKGEDHPRVQVACATCHHGKPVPRTLQDVLGATLAERGVAAAGAQYRELREKFYGRDAYDFGEQPLNRLAESLADANKTADAIALLELNSEFNPQSPMVHGLLGAAYEQAGQRDKAIATYKKVLTLAPNDERAKARLAALQSGARK